jgi:hypothetical protein
VQRDDKTDEEMELAKVDVSVNLGQRVDQPVPASVTKGDDDDSSDVSTASTRSHYVAKSKRVGTQLVGEPLPEPKTE